eukprot:12104-Heterococcus_DN1.PRE.8
MAIAPAAPTHSGVSSSGSAGVALSTCHPAVVLLAVACVTHKITAHTSLRICMLTLHWDTSVKY